MWKRSHKTRTGLQIKATIALVAVVVSAAGLGGWASHSLMARWMTQNQAEEAGRLANTLRVMATDPIVRSDVPALHKAAEEFLLYEGVLSVAILNDRGEPLAFAGRPEADLMPVGADAALMEMAYAYPIPNQRLLAGRPIVSGHDSEGRIVGAVRLSMDTRAAASRLRKAQTVMGLLICGFVVAFVPVAHLLIRRVVVRPIEKLAAITERLADGDYAARAETGQNDEIGSLGASFNAMAEKIDTQHTLLVQTNEHLEELVAVRTAKLDSANRRLQTEMREKEDFLRVVSHDLNAPLRNIAGMATMIRMKWADALPETVLTRLERIEANVKTQTGLLNDLLELSRIASRPAAPESVDMNELLADVGDCLEFDLQNRNIEFTVAPNMPELFIERDHMRQVFQNLVDNAVKYMGRPDRGHIAITCDADAEMFTFHVADNGVGIDPEDHKRIFTIFRRARDVSADAPGKGVGLAAVAAVAAKYEGRVWVDSEVSVGSTFHVSLRRSCCEIRQEECVSV